MEGAEGCILIGVTTGPAGAAQASLDELSRLADTAGLVVLDRVLQVRRKYDGRFVMGKGKLQDVLIRAMQLGAEVLAFDQELAPSQLRNIATATDLKVIDRTQLILDIFAQRAKSREGKLQVELASAAQALPAVLHGHEPAHGGIGGRGPGRPASSWAGRATSGRPVWRSSSPSSPRTPCRRGASATTCPRWRSSGTPTRKPSCST